MREKTSSNKNAVGVIVYDGSHCILVFTHTHTSEKSMPVLDVYKKLKAVPNRARPKLLRKIIRL